MSAPTIARAGGARTRHYTGARVTHVTYRGVVEMSDGERVQCPHDGHRSAEAAARCAVKVAKAGR